MQGSAGIPWRKSRCIFPPMISSDPEGRWVLLLNDENLPETVKVRVAPSEIEKIIGLTPRQVSSSLCGGM
jgi:hypothetical protein